MTRFFRSIQSRILNCIGREELSISSNKWTYLREMSLYVVLIKAHMQIEPTFNKGNYPVKFIQTYQLNLYRRLHWISIIFSRNHIFYQKFSLTIQAQLERVILVWKFFHTIIAEPSDVFMAYLTFFVCAAFADNSYDEMFPRYFHIYYNI